MKVICKNCGTEIDQWDAVEINTGRIQYMCQDCYKAGVHQYNMHNLIMNRKREKNRHDKNGK